MTPDDRRLDRECRVFTRLLIGTDPTPYVVAKYTDAHRVRPDLDQASGFERALIERAASGVIASRLADAYARRMLPRGVLRKKLVALLAILETAPGLHRHVDTAPERSLVAALVSLAIAGFAGVAATIVGLIVFSAMRIAWREDARP